VTGTGGGAYNTNATGFAVERQGGLEWQFRSRLARPSPAVLRRPDLGQRGQHGSTASSAAGGVAAASAPALRKAASKQQKAA